MSRPCWRLACHNKPWLEFANAPPKGKHMIDETRYLSATKGFRKTGARSKDKVP